MEPWACISCVVLLTEKSFIIRSLIFEHLFSFLIYIFCLHFLLNGFQRLFPAGLGHDQSHMLTNDLEYNILPPPSCSPFVTVRYSTQCWLFLCGLKPNKRIKYIDVIGLTSNRKITCFDAKRYQISKCNLLLI